MFTILHLITISPQNSKEPKFPPPLIANIFLSTYFIILQSNEMKKKLLNGFSIRNSFKIIILHEKSVLSNQTPF